MELETIAIFRSPFATKFGIPRQSGLVPGLRGRIVFAPAFRDSAALRGIEGYDYLWLIWGFSGGWKLQGKGLGDSGRARKNEGIARESEGMARENEGVMRESEGVARVRDGGGMRDGMRGGEKGVMFSPTVRPPVLGGNVRMGVWATRSPNRPNPIGLSSVKIESVEWDTPEGPVIHVLGGDLMDGTPIYDIKPYVTYSDAHPDARSGFAEAHKGERLQVVVPEEMRRVFGEEDLATLKEILACDPRPRYHDDGERVYGMDFMGHDVKFSIRDGVVRCTMASDDG